jgi:hypothetical protein
MGQREFKMAKELMSMEAFHELVMEYIREAVNEEMLKEFNQLEEMIQGTSPSQPSVGTIGSSGSAGTLSTKSTKPTNSGNNDPANNVLVPGTNMNINQGLQAASKETNFKKKADLVNKMSAQIQGMKGVVIK